VSLAGHVAVTRRKEMRVGLWVRKTEGNRSLVIYRPKWEGSTENVMRNRKAAPGLV
jgi:hypothetical protein